MERKRIFRKSAIEYVSSPEQLTDYIRVTTPGAWGILAASIILLAALFVWTAFGRVDVKRTDANGRVYTETVRPIDLVFGK